MSNQPHILAIAGTDPTGSAGIAIDIKTLCYFNINPAIAITAINVQDNHSVKFIKPISSSLLKQQIECAINASNIKFVKIGMIYSNENAIILSELLHKHKLITIFDPVLKSSSNYDLSEPNLKNFINNYMLPKISLLTPNLLELAVLTEKNLAKNNSEAIKQANYLIEKYNAPAILIKGGHSSDIHNSTDILCLKKKEPYLFTNKRLLKQKRGTGCALSSAIAANLAKNYNLIDAIAKAKEYIEQYIAE